MLTVLFPLLLQTSSIFSRPVIFLPCSKAASAFANGLAVVARTAIPTTNLDGRCVHGLCLGLAVNVFVVVVVCVTKNVLHVRLLPG